MIRELKNLYHLLLAVLASFWYGFPGRKLTVIGVTGTDGKTTTTTLIHELLKAIGKKVSMISTVGAVIAGKTYDIGFHVTNPDPWDLQKYLRQSVDGGDEYMVLEVTSHGIDQNRVWGIPFAIGVITNVTHEHLDWHGTFDQYLLTKLRLVQWAKRAVINRDDPSLYTHVNSYPTGDRLTTFGLGKNADVNPTIYSFTTTLPGDYNKSNILAALAVGQILKLDKQEMLKTVAGFEGIVGRMEMTQKKPFRVIVDFAHTPNALLQVLSTVKKTTKGKLIHVFGCAGLRDHTKRPLMGEASEQYADTIVLTEEDTRIENVSEIMDDISSGFKKKKVAHRYPDRREAIAYALKIATPGDTVILTGKGHEKSLCRGTTEYPWSDQETVKELLEKNAHKK